MLMAFCLPLVWGEKGGFLWRIHNGSAPVSHLFGTLRVPYLSVWGQIMPEAKDAMRRAETIYTEYDFATEQTRIDECADELAKSDEVPELPKELIERAANYYLVPPEFLRNLNAMALMLNLQRDMSEIKEESVTLDLYLSAIMARNWSIPARGLESSRERCSLMTELSSAAVLGSDQILTVLEKRLPIYLDTIFSYIAGSGDFFEENYIFVPPYYKEAIPQLPEEIEAGLIKSTFIERNKIMAARIANLLRNEPKRYVFALGVGHFFGGNHSLVSLLQREGFHVERIEHNSANNLGNAVSGLLVPILLAAKYLLN